MRFAKSISSVLLAVMLAACGGGDERSAASPHIAAAVTTPIVPESGVWWNPAESGRGFSLEVQGNVLSLAAYLYEVDGRATWYSTGGSLNPDGTFDGTLQEYKGGQSITASYKPASIKADASAVRLVCGSTKSCTLTWSGGTIPIQRFLFGGSTIAANPPESGVWWNPAEGGRGYFIDVQSNIISFSAYLYDAAGNATWYSSSGNLNADGSFDGKLQEYSGGQSLNATHKPPIIKGDVSSMRLVCSSPSTCTMTWAGGAVPLQRFVFGVAPISTGSTAPGTPVIGAVTPVNNSAVIAFTPSASTGGAPITNYIATCQSGASKFTGWALASPVTVSGMTGGLTYSCTVVALNSVGSSPSSAASNVTIVAPSLTLLRPADSFFGGGDTVLTMPFDTNASMSASVQCVGSGCATVYDLDTFKLRAIGKSYTISELQAQNLSAGSTVVPAFSGLANGQVIAAGQTVTFKLQSTFTRGARVQLLYTFKVVETGEVFRYSATLMTN